MAKKQTPETTHGNEHEANDPNIIECRYDACKTKFKRTRRDEFFHTYKCYLLHKAAKVREKNDLSKKIVDLMLANEQMLKELFEKGIYQIESEKLFKKGFNREAPSLLIVDEKYGLITMKFFNYGVRLIGEGLYQIVYFKGSLLKK